jgi:ribosome-associated protein
MAKRAAPHRGIDVHYGEPGDAAGDDARPSKTRLKQQSHDLQTLGVAVAGLSDERLARIEMPDTLREAIEAYRRTRSHEGRRRQMQYVGKLMRSADEEALREAVAEASIGSARETLRLHEAEQWRDALIADDEAFTRFAALHPGVDLQQLRALARQARKDAPPPEAVAGQGPRHGRAYRDLFRSVRDALGTQDDVPDRAEP